MSYKKVCHIIEVPFGEYCWNSKDEICNYFDNEGGHPTCILDFGDLIYNEQGIVEKPPRCKKLQEIKLERSNSNNGM